MRNLLLALACLATALNRTNFGAPNGNRSAVGFGTTSTFDPRHIQLGVKLNS